MPQASCLARLTDWEKTRILVGPSHVSFARLCKNPVRNDESLCEECSMRGLQGCIYTQSRMIHGLLTQEPPKDSLIYGSKGFWKLVKEYGMPGLAEAEAEEEAEDSWLAAAIAAQEEGERRCFARGLDPWLVQRPAHMSEEMVKKVVPKVAAPGAKGTILAVFPQIRTMYEESDKPPEKLETDTCKIHKEVFGDIPVWISESGHVFDCDTTGEPGEFMGMMVDGELVTSK
jgi:hypothetical protein